MSLFRSLRVLLIGTLSLVLVLPSQVMAASTEESETAAPTATNEDYYKQLELFEHALAIVRADYVEEPDPKDLIYGAVRGMLSTLDPHSQFLDPDSYNELRVDTEGEFGGLGIEITIRDGLLTVITPIDGTPAAEAGLRTGDIIVKIDDELTRGLTLIEAVKKLRGAPNTQVKLTVLSEGEDVLKDFVVTRDIIKIESIREAKIIEDNIGYIRLSDFRENSAKDLEEAVHKLKEQSMDSLILDLRNNPGGLLNVSRSVAEVFLKHGQLVVSTRGRLRNQNMELRAKKDGDAQDELLVVLINQGSASASEIVAGAIQDHHRGVILGERSHGKASVQTIFPLKDGSALKLTTSKYFTPSGRSIHGEGIQPDVVVPFVPAAEGKEKDKADVVFERVESEETKGAKDEQAKQDAAKAKEDKAKEEEPLDNQLARAVDLLKGLKVYRSMNGGSSVN